MLQVDVEVYQMRIDVVQDSVFRSQTERRGESATERLNVTPGRLRFPKRRQFWQQPTLSACPFQWRLPRVAIWRGADGGCPRINHGSRGCQGVLLLSPCSGSGLCLARSGMVLAFTRRRT